MIEDFMAQRGTTNGISSAWIPDSAGDGWEYMINPSTGKRTYRQNKHGIVSYGQSPKTNPASYTSKPKYSYKGKYRPMKITNMDSIWCDETGDWRHKDVVVKLGKGVGTRLLHPGTGRFAFAVYPWRGMTAIRLYDKKNKTHLSTRLFNGEMSPEDAKERIFSKARNIKSVRKDTQRPYRAIFRHVIMQKDAFENGYSPNTGESSSYQTHKNPDTALRSLSGIIDGSDGDEFICGTPSSVIEKCHKRFNRERNSYNGPFPCVEVFAIWLNFDPETNIVHEEYDAWEPIHYSFHRYESKKEMMEHPL